MKLIVETSRLRSFVRLFLKDIIENLWFSNFFEFCTKNVDEKSFENNNVSWNNGLVFKEMPTEGL